MGHEEMDEYIRFCEGALLGRDERPERRRRVEDRRRKLCGEEKHSLFAGEEYKTWNEAEGSEEYEIVLERGKILLGVEAEYLNRIVRRMDIT